MAINTVLSSSPITNPEDSLQDASADLSVCDTMILAVENFVDEVRSYSAPRDGIRPDEHIFRPVLRAMTMIDEARDRLQEAKAKIDGSVDALIKARLGT